MERVAFLIEETNQRLGCLLNPENLTVRRAAGVRPRRAATGQLTGAALDDDPLLYTGGGRTVLELNLLFDVALAGSSITKEDVRELTEPLWNLSENTSRRDGYGRPPLVRFIWGKSWNMPGIIVSVAERLERFTRAGVPQRSWLRMRMYRLSEDALRSLPPGLPSPLSREGATEMEDITPVHETLGGPAGVIDILAAALSGTTAGRTLAAVSEGISSSAAEIESLLSALTSPDADGPKHSADDDGQASAAQSIRGALATITSAAFSMIPEGDGSILDSITASSVSIASASEDAETALETMPSGDDPTSKSRMRSLLNGIRGTAERSVATVGVIVSHVRYRSARIISTTLQTMDAAVSRLESGLSTIPPTISVPDSPAMQVFESAIVDLRSMLVRVKQEGEAAAVRQVPAALEKMGAALEVLWSKGAHGAGRIITSAVESTSLAVRDASVALEAIASVSLSRAGEVLTDQLEALKDVRDADEEASEQRRRKAVSGARMTLGTMESVAKAESLEAASDELKAIRDDIDRLESVEIDELIDELPAIRERMAEAVERLNNSEEAATKEMIRTVVATRFEDAEEPDEAGLSSEGAPGEGLGDEQSERVQLGERLDQVAFRYYRDPAAWRRLAVQNNINDPLHLSSGRLLRIPPQR